MSKARNDKELAGRFWHVVEQLAADGNQYVEIAIHTSLVEWFAWGDEDERAALTDAETLLGEATARMVEAYRP